MIWILLAIAMIAVGISIVKLRADEKTQLRKELVKELRHSGRLSRDVDSLYLEIDKKNKELKNSKDRSVELMAKFVRMNAKKQ